MSLVREMYLASISHPCATMLFLIMSNDVVSVLSGSCMGHLMTVDLSQGDFPVPGPLAIRISSLGRSNIGFCATSSVEALEETLQTRYCASYQRGEYLTLLQHDRNSAIDTEGLAVQGI